MREWLGSMMGPPPAAAGEDAIRPRRFPGGISGGATPDPIPNSVVKPTRADGTGRASDRESRSLPGFYFHLKRPVVIAIALGFLGAIQAHARDLGPQVFPIHAGKFTSSLLYEYLKIHEDFGSRGSADFRSHVSGAHFSYGATDQLAVALKGGVLIDPQEEAQGAKWQGRAGYLYGFDIINEVFPATGVQPGVQLSGGVTGFEIPLDRLISQNTVSLIDQKISGLEYHGSLIATMRLKRVTPYGGLRGFGSSMHWRNNQPGSSGPDSISGHAKGHISLVVGAPVQLTPDLRFQAEGVFLNETMITAGFTIAVY